MSSNRRMSNTTSTGGSVDLCVMLTYHNVMSSKHDKKPARIGEPLQVYLEREERARLDWLVTRLATTKSAVVRQALLALERELRDPEGHPALRLIGIARDPAAPSEGVAETHDRHLAEGEVGSWVRNR